MPNHMEYRERYEVTRTVTIYIDMVLTSSGWKVCGIIHCKHSTAGTFAEFEMPACAFEVALPKARATIADYLNNFKLLIEAGVFYA